MLKTASFYHRVPNTGLNFKSIAFLNPEIKRFSTNLGKKGKLGPVCKIIVNDRVAKIAPIAQIGNLSKWKMSNEVSDKKLEQKI